ncbi:LysR substrate-binding domain-containing protein [Geodermatophilus aquaeductus]|uniref:Transcriptional regulator, LysR family n=1 Tax=Geodermatophilus aquaeductus TaxID=1564161 RepID=A0A521E1U8_9ACTN|nr:LysR family transcriptional regulator [Geodermatophilus aquaeductus]SMO77918.1 transcriptional regulator, LysR family [Geodermatophilus aquaeductus]
MELRQLEYFLAVVEEGSFTRAAARLFMVQSSLSASLLGLERELGTDLFIRGRKGAELTDAGRALLEPARAALHDAERARDAVAEVAGLLRGSVRVATVAVPRDVDVFETIGPFHERHPGVAITVLHDGARDLLGLVADGDADFAITPLTHRTTPALRFDPLLSTPLVLLCPPTHRLAGARDVDLGDVVDEKLIDLPRGWWVRELFDRMFAERGLPRRVRLEVDEWFGVLTLVRRGMGIACGPLACVDETLSGDVAVATLGGAPTWQVGIATREEALRGAAGRAFLNAYRDQCRVRVGD